MNTALVVTAEVSSSITQPKPLSPAQLGWRCQRAAVKLQNKSFKDRSVEKTAGRVSTALFEAAVCFLAASERGNKRAAKDAADGAKAFAKAVKLAGADVKVLDAVKMLGAAS